jgi:hypothetical protein
MTETRSERRLAENEAMFRKLNEQIQTGIHQTNLLAEADQQPEFYIEPKSDDAPLQFLCECADEKCTGRVELNIFRYKEIHSTRDQFVVIPGHEIPQIEIVIREEPGYKVVKKRVDPPETGHKLHPTSLDNTKK